VETWIDRHAAEGQAGLVDRSSRPHSMPTRTGCSRPAECDPMTGEVIRSSKTTAVRYEKSGPVSCSHGRQEARQDPRGGGWRGRGQTAANHQSRPDKTRVGYHRRTPTDQPTATNLMVGYAASMARQPRGMNLEEPSSPSCVAGP
jgi:hypothetical protein